MTYTNLRERDVMSTFLYSGKVTADGDDDDYTIKTNDHLHN